jgi:hypothetical protein
MQKRSSIMTTEALNLGLAGTTTGVGLGDRFRAALKRAGARFVAAQERRARHIAGPYLVRHSDEELLGAGFTTVEIAALRRMYGH